MISAGGRLSRNRFIVRPGRWEDTAATAAARIGVGIVGMELKSIFIVEKPDSKGRCGELKVLDEAENSDSERLRFRTIVRVVDK